MSNHVTIEKTKKRYKLMRVVGIAAFALGIAVVAASGGSQGNAGKLAPMSVTGIWIVGASIAWLAVVRGLTWWNHG